MCIRDSLEALHHVIVIKDQHHDALVDHQRRVQGSGPQILLHVVPDVGVGDTDGDGAAETILQLSLGIDALTDGHQVFVAGGAAPDINLRATTPQRQPEGQQRERYQHRAHLSRDRHSFHPISVVSTEASTTSSVA